VDETNCEKCGVCFMYMGERPKLCPECEHGEPNVRANYEIEVGVSKATGATYIIGEKKHDHSG